MSFLKKIFGKEWRVKVFERTENTVENMRLAEKTLWYGAFFVFAVSGLMLLSRVNTEFIVETPARGGTLIEGIVGTPRFANPLLSISDADKDLTSLLYSGLVRKRANSVFIPDLAKSWSVSDDSLIYTFILKDNLTWSDGAPLTTDDIIFTIEKARDPNLKSYRRAEWEGITMEKISDKELRFALSQPYASFLDNATLGILPKHIWENIETDEFPFSEQNVEPVGSGPYKVERIRRNGSGVPAVYELRARKDYALNEPYLTHITIKFYGNEKMAIEAYQSGDIMSLAGISPSNTKNIEERSALRQTPITRLFGIFFNQNQNEALLDAGARRALLEAIDKKLIVDSVLEGFGTITDSPIPGETSADMAPDKDNVASSTVEKAIGTLERSGWKKNTDTLIWEKKIDGRVRALKLSLSTSNIPELVETARLVESAWISIGVVVDVRIFEISDLNQNVIRPRKYDALLFGTVITNNADLYAFWHSSQRNDPGLNIAMYTNSKVDSILEILRKTNDPEVLLESREAFKEEVSDDVPAIFLYSPDFIYLLSPNIKNVELGPITSSDDRFMNVYEWYSKTDSVWKIFAKNDR